MSWESIKSSTEAAIEDLKRKLGEAEERTEERVDPRVLETATIQCDAAREALSRKIWSGENFGLGDQNSPENLVCRTITFREH